jgi:hypothetical protein
MATTIAMAITAAITVTMAGVRQRDRQTVAAGSDGPALRTRTRRGDDPEQVDVAALNQRSRTHTTDCTG